MDIRVSGHQIDTGAALQEHVDDRLNSIVEKYFSRAISSHVTFGKGPGGSFTSDIVTHVMQGLILKGHAEAHDDHGDHGHDDHADDDHGAEESSSASVTQITVINGNRDGRRSGIGHGAGGRNPDHGGSLSPRERDHAIRAAIADLNDWWRDKDARIGEMRAAHRELSAD